MKNTKNIFSVAALCVGMRHDANNSMEDPPADDASTERAAIRATRSVCRGHRRKTVLPILFAATLIIPVLSMPLLTGCASSQAAKTEEVGLDSNPPIWLSNPDAVYSSSRYVSAVGSGYDRSSAEKSALTSLTAVFGQSISSDTTVSSRYLDSVKSGILQSTSASFSIDESITTAVSLDTLVGAEIKETWTDAAGKYTYAIAVMDKPKAAILYADLIKSNDNLIASLIDIPEGDKGTFTEYSRLRLAADTADANEHFINVLSVVSPASAAATRSSRESGDVYRMKASTAAAGIPISVYVSNDVTDMAAQAFSSVFSASNFRTTTGAGKYALTGEVTFSEVTLPNNPNTFSRAVLNARLADAETGEVLLPYSTSVREGHASLSEANNRAVRSLAKKIESDFAANFDTYLQTLIQ